MYFTVVLPLKKTWNKWRLIPCFCQLWANYIHLAYHIYVISLWNLFYIYQNINFEMASFFKCLQIHNVWGAFNQIYIQFPALLVFLISITIILSPLDFNGIFHPWTLEGFTNIIHTTVLWGAEISLTPYYRWGNKHRKVNNTHTIFYLYSAFDSKYTGTFIMLVYWRTELKQAYRLTD